MWILSFSQSQQPLWTVASRSLLLGEGHRTQIQKGMPHLHTMHPHTHTTNTYILGRRPSCFVTCKDQGHIGGLIFQVCLPLCLCNGDEIGLNWLADRGKCESLKVNLLCTTGHKTLKFSACRARSLLLGFTLCLKTKPALLDWLHLNYQLLSTSFLLFWNSKAGSILGAGTSHGLVETKLFSTLGGLKPRFDFFFPAC